MHLATYLQLLITTERALADSHRTVAAGHRDDADVHYTCARFADECTARAEALEPILARYDDAREPEPERLHPGTMTSARRGPVGLLRDLQELDQLANLAQTTWTLVGQAAQGARDRELIDLTADGGRDVAAQLAWLRARMSAAAPQTLLVAR